MPTTPTYLTQQQSRLLASRHLLSFLFVPNAPASATPDDLFNDRFSVTSLPASAFTGGPDLFRWKSRIIYDVDDLELFHDHSLDLASDNELTVRVAASDWLGTPVWSISAGPEYITLLMKKTLAFITGTDYLEPVYSDGEETVRIVCYDYPKLGIKCRKGAEFVIVDLADQIIIPIDRSAVAKYPSPRTVWSPYDNLTGARIGHRRWAWQRKNESVPEWKANKDNLHDQIASARQGVVIKLTTPNVILVGQQTDYYCAPATAQMILKQHGMTKSQNEIADAMETTEEDGSSLQNQETSIAELTDSALEGDLDNYEDFAKAQAEILANRSFKSGTVTDHARACGGYKLHNGIKWLIIYDPWPSNQGRRKFEEWDAGDHKNFMYVRPA